MASSMAKIKVRRPGRVKPFLGQLTCEEELGGSSTAWDPLGQRSLPYCAGYSQVDSQPQAQ